MTSFDDIPLVSVCMITYNHERYIEDAIEGVLMQETSFPIELVIGEDCSTDSTRKICLDYQARHPDLLRVLQRKANMGISANFADTLSHCNGRFVAICEGDDFWTDPNKLQLQADFLMNNPEFAMCAHADTVLNADGTMRDRPLLDTELEIEDLLPMNLRGEFVPTLSWLFRRSACPNIPDSLRDVFFDIVLLMLIASTGKVRVFSNTMAVYRLHSENWTNSGNGLKKTEFLAEAMELTKQHLFPLASEQFDLFLASSYADASFFAFQQADLESFCKNYRKAQKSIRFLGYRKRFGLFLRQLASQNQTIYNSFLRFRAYFRQA